MGTPCARLVSPLELSSEGRSTELGGSEPAGWVWLRVTPVSGNEDSLGAKELGLADVLATAPVVEASLGLDELSPAKALMVGGRLFRITLSIGSENDGAEIDVVPSNTLVDVPVVCCLGDGFDSTLVSLAGTLIFGILGRSTGCGLLEGGIEVPATVVPAAQ